MTAKSSIDNNSGKLYYENSSNYNSGNRSINDFCYSFSENREIDSGDRSTSLENVANLGDEEEKAKRHRDLYFQDKQKELLRFQNRKIIECLPEEGKILDAGCGVGVLLFTLPEKYGYTGVDSSKNALSTARKHFPERKFVRDDLLNLQFKDNEFDAVVLKGVLHHLRKPGKAAKEFKRVLKPSGKLIVFEGARESSFRKLVTGIADLVDPEHEVSEFRHRSRTEWRRIFEQEGFVEESYEKIGGINVVLRRFGFSPRVDWDNRFSSIFHWHNLAVYSDEGELNEE